MVSTRLELGLPRKAPHDALAGHPPRREWLDDQAPRYSLRRYLAVRSVMNLTARLYSNVRVEGLDRLPDGPAVLCFSHQNWADPFYVVAGTRSCPQLYFFGPEQEEMRKGIRNRLMRWSGVVIPYRPGRRGLVAATARAESVLAAGGVVAIAGEGKIHAGEEVVLPLRDGPAYLSLRCGVPLVPMAINGTSWLGFRQGVRIRIGEPIFARPATPRRPTAEDVDILTAEAQVALERLVGDFPDRPPAWPLGRRVTELFNVWPDGARPGAEERGREMGRARPPDPRR